MKRILREMTGTWMSPIMKSNQEKLIRMSDLGPFRTSFPLFSLFYPGLLPSLSRRILNTYKDTGFLPKWLALDERGMMPGTLIDGIFADAVTKGIAPDLHENMLTAMLQTAQKQILLNILVAMAMKATRPLATYPMIFTKV